MTLVRMLPNHSAEFGKLEKNMDGDTGRAGFRIFFGSVFHNFIDGIAISGVFLVSVLSLNPSSSALSTKIRYFRCAWRQTGVPYAVSRGISLRSFRGRQ
jgi:zinc transporter ZupT